MKESKLKYKETGMIAFTLAIIGSMVAAALVFGRAGFSWAFASAQILMTTIHFVVLARTRNWIYVIPTSMYGLWALTFLPPLAAHPWHDVFAVASAVFLAAFIGVLFSKRINWRYREILELAARPVEEAGDGFTPRPFPSGPADFTRTDALGLARFLLKHVVCYPIVEPDRVIMVIPRVMWTYLLFLKRRYDDATYVALTDSGEVVVHIASTDYRKFKKELTFDRICRSLGDVFRKFLQLYQEGRRKEIISMLNAL